MKCKCDTEKQRNDCFMWKSGICRFPMIGYKLHNISSPIKLNGFNNGKDTSDGVGGKPGPFDDEFLDRVENAVLVLKSMLRVAALKQGYRVADELLEEINQKRNEQTTT
jgi:hypothetical protein